MKKLIAFFCALVSSGVAPASATETPNKIAPNHLAVSGQLHLIKDFKLKPGEFKAIATGLGGCIATDQITVDGVPVGYMVPLRARPP